jgi:hypothetical protein
MLKRTDLLWLLAYPIYQIIGTLRHEGSHALAGVLSGVQIQKFVFLPSITNGQMYWGYVNFQGPVDWPVLAAPYLVDLLTFSFFFVICLRIKFARRWLWLNLVIIGLISPLINSAYNYLGGLSHNNDVGFLLRVLPSTGVHVYFVGTLLLYVIGLIRVFRHAAATSSGIAAAKAGGA